MLLKKKRQDERIRPLQGWAKFFHRLGRLILFPLRRPVLTLVILLILFLAPTFRGVKPVDVPRWYASQVYGVCNKVLVWWGIRQPEVAPGSFKFNPEDAAPAPVAPSEFETPEPIDDNAPNILDVLKGADKGEETTQTEDEEQSTPDESQASQVEDEGQPQTRSDIRIPVDERMYAYPADKKVSSLKYVDFPHEVVGKAVVHDSNEIEVNGEFIMMYGVFVHPYTARGVSATKYLKDLIDGKEIKCGVVAYTEQDIATGICYYNGINLNRDMVLKGYTRNVAL